MKLPQSQHSRAKLLIGLEIECDRKPPAGSGDQVGGSREFMGLTVKSGDNVTEK